MMKAKIILILPVIMVIYLFSSCEDGTGTGGNGEKSWLDSIQNDSGSSLVKAIWLENNIETPYFSFEYDSDGKLILWKNEQSGDFAEYSYFEDGRLKEKIMHVQGGTLITSVSYDDINNIVHAMEKSSPDSDSTNSTLITSQINREEGTELCEFFTLAFVGNDQFEKKVVSQVEYTLDENDIISSKTWNSDENGQMVAGPIESYTYDQNINPLFQPDFPLFLRQAYEMGKYNLLTITPEVGSVINYFFDYKHSGLPFKKKQAGKPTWIYQYY